MFFGINDILSAWDHISGNVLALTGSPVKGNTTVDHSYITPTIIALGEFHEKHIDDLKRITQGDPVLVWNLGERDISSICRNVFNNQIIDAPFNGACPYTKAPQLETIFQLCETIKCWYDLNDKNLAIIHCPAGLPSTGILIACLLRYIGAFMRTEEAYDFYCSRRLKDDPRRSLAPSYRTLFENVDKTVEHQGYTNIYPLHLKTINIAG